MSSENPRHSYTGDIDVGHIGMPMLVGPQRLDESRPLFGGLTVEGEDAAGVFEHAINAGRAGGRHIGIEHHPAQATVAFERELPFEVEDGLFFGLGQPMFPWYPCVMPVDLSETIFPGIKLIGPDAQPSDQPLRRQVGPDRPVMDEINDLIADIVRGPLAVQSRPSFFFRATYSPMSSARTSFFC